MTKPLRIVGARVWQDSRHEESFHRNPLYMTDRIFAEAHPHALTVDLEGYTIFPALINAHDHLDRNHYPRTKFRERYDNAHQWGEEMTAHLDEPPFKELRAYPLEDKCLIGGLKNLLCGALTVAHHDPPHKPLFKPDFPVRVLKNYGWAHSLHFTPEQEIIDSYRRTPKNAPFFIHLAEGTDEIAASEYERLDALGCMESNTVVIHGVGSYPTAVIKYLYRPESIDFVWCPSSNLFLLGETVDISHYWVVTVQQAALGSDSRLTAAGDLLDDMSVGINEYKSIRWFEHDILEMVTDAGARTLRLPDVGHLKPTAHADFIAIRNTDNPTLTLCQSKRADLALVVRGGIPQIGDPDLMEKFPHVPTVEATLDGVPKRIHENLARQITRCALKEPGLEIMGSGKVRRWF